MSDMRVFNNNTLGLQVRTVLNDEGSISVNAEDTAIGFGWIQKQIKIGERGIIPLDFLWHRYCYLIVAQKVGDDMSPRTGRPKIEKPKTYEIKVRIDEEVNQKLIRYCKENNVTRTDVIRQGVYQILGITNNTIGDKFGD